MNNGGEVEVVWVFTQKFFYRKESNSWVVGTFRHKSDAVKARDEKMEDEVRELELDEEYTFNQGVSETEDWKSWSCGCEEHIFEVVKQVLQ